VNCGLRRTPRWPSPDAVVQAFLDSECRHVSNYAGLLKPDPGGVGMAPRRLTGCRCPRSFCYQRSCARATWLPPGSDVHIERLGRSLEMNTSHENPLHFICDVGSSAHELGRLATVTRLRSAGTPGPLETRQATPVTYQMRRQVVELRDLECVSAGGSRPGTIGIASGSDVGKTW